MHRPRTAGHRPPTQRGTYLIQFPHVPFALQLLLAHSSSQLHGVFLLRLRLELHEDGGVGETMGLGAGVSGLMPEGGLQTLDVGFPEAQLPEQQSEPSWHA